MAGASGQKMDSMALEIFHIFVVINAFHRIYPTVAVVETHGQGLWFCMVFRDGLSVLFDGVV